MLISVLLFNFCLLGGYETFYSEYPECCVDVKPISQEKVETERALISQCGKSVLNISYRPAYDQVVWCGSTIWAPGSVACIAPWLSLSPITNVGWFFCGSGSWQRPLALENLCCLPTRVSIQEYMGFLPANKLSKANTLQDARWLLEKRGSERYIIVSWPGRCREASK